MNRHVGASSGKLVHSGRTHQDRSQSPVAWMAGKREDQMRRLAALIDPGANRLPQSNARGHYGYSGIAGTYGPCNGSIGLWNVTGARC